MTAITATQIFNKDRTGTGANTIVAWLIARIKRRRYGGRRRRGSVQLSDATLSDLGITREQVQFGENRA